MIKGLEFRHLRKNAAGFVMSGGVTLFPGNKDDKVADPHRWWRIPNRGRSGRSPGPRLIDMHSQRQPDAMHALSEREVQCADLTLPTPSP